MSISVKVCLAASGRLFVAVVPACGDMGTRHISRCLQVNPWACSGLAVPAVVLLPLPPSAPAAQLATAHAPAVQVGTAKARGPQAAPHMAQLVKVLRGASQPLVASLSQSPQPAAGIGKTVRSTGTCREHATSALL